MKKMSVFLCSSTQTVVQERQMKRESLKKFNIKIEQNPIPTKNSNEKFIVKFLKLKIKIQNNYFRFYFHFKSKKITQNFNNINACLK